jgi:hypothetical protein
MTERTQPSADVAHALISWLVTSAVGPAAVALPVNWTADKLAGAAGRWFKRLRQTDDLSRLVKAAGGASADLSRAEISSVRKLLENEQTWRLLSGRDVSQLAARIASCLQSRDVRTAHDSLAMASIVARGLLEFAVYDLQPEIFQKLVQARLQHLVDQASDLDQALLHLHSDLYAQLAEVTALVKRMLELQPGPAGRGEITIYLQTLIAWLNTDSWPRDQRLGGPVLTPADIERKLRITTPSPRHEKDLDADKLARQCARLVVLGGPGAGKTWLAKRAARVCAEEALQALAADETLDTIELPLYTTCSRLATAQGSIREAAVRSALDGIGDLGGSRISNALREFFADRNHPTLLVLDSLDEARGADDRIRPADTLPQPWRIVLTSRPGSWNHQLAIGSVPSRRVGVLQPLRYPHDVEPFIDRWFSEEPARGADLAAQLRDHPALRQAATVPLMLAFFCIVGGNEPLPGCRTALYAKVIRRMLTGRWRGSGDRDPDPDACLERLRDWAWSAAASDSLSGVGAWADEFPTPRVRQSQDDRDALDHVAAPLSQADPDTGMIRRRFVHRSLREHLVAEHIALRMSAEEAAEELVNHLWYDPDWEHAAPAALGMHPQRDQVLKELLCRAANGGGLPADVGAIDECWEIRRFLARVAHESGEDDWGADAVEMIGQARMDLAMSRHASLREILPDWPVSNRLIIDWVLAQLTGQTEVHWAEELADAVARLNSTADDRARARRALLDLIASADDELVVQGLLAGPFAGLDPAVEERAQVLQALLAGGISPWAPWLLGRAVAGLAVTGEERAQAREALLALLARETEPYATLGWAAAVAMLDPTAEDRMQARQALLAVLLGGVEGRRFAGEMAEVVAQLALTADDTAQTRQALLAVLSGQTSPWAAVYLMAAVAALEPTADEQAQARHVLLALLREQTHPATAQMLADTVAALEPTADEQAQARHVLLALLRDQTDPRLARELADTIIALEPTTEEQAQARHALLALLGLAARARYIVLHGISVQTDPRLAREVADTITALEPTAEDRAQARQVLLAVLGAQTDLGRAGELADTITALEPTAEDRAQARQVLLAVLGAQTDPRNDARRLADAITALEPTADEQAQARHALLALLPAQTDRWAAKALTDAVARLSPTAADLGGFDDCPFPPTAALLAAVRENTGLRAWLTVLPLLSGFAHTGFESPVAPASNNG